MLLRRRKTAVLIFFSLPYTFDFSIPFTLYVVEALGLEFTAEYEIPKGPGRGGT